MPLKKPSPDLLHLLAKESIPIHPGQKENIKNASFFSFPFAHFQSKQIYASYTECATNLFAWLKLINWGRKWKLKNGSSSQSTNSLSRALRMMEHERRCRSWFCLEENRLLHLGLNTQEQSWGLGGGGCPQNNVCIILKIINFLQMFCKLSCSRAQAVVLSKSLGVVLDIHLLFPNAIQSFFPPLTFFSVLKLAAISLSLTPAVATASAIPQWTLCVFSYSFSYPPDKSIIREIQKQAENWHS